ncbi:bifunctional 2-C-methyl-D-erythritol 4-phosphate cytidylyltransferase/2-C-methyl-D-erythritol 2,4-cyclodiphosphate synthase [candidate division LCP-89 bacterium B3_LCP]|uniref:Bifunctional enzyme IspD/IspF n=1 Tax=candidate division LCP-89 bacterium B3_LCP TaxID=2012998 RepID=A0A532V5W1_UNCL8|nr:MAG: bifunctional 2-C-methyl-D-erythritol 4-phosphate cytidylyltransferase/2-C-methyl-D-erythritol 2,4-cyclodiphosphate synthase [candidate division LCP-89 bacterium B3_LCP]
MSTQDNKGITAIIVAAGSGVRLSADCPKPLIQLGNRPLVSFSLEAFELSPKIGNIVLVAGQKWLKEADDISRTWAPTKLFSIVKGGKERFDSVRAGMDKLPDNCRIVAVHDAARPFISQRIINDTIGALGKFHGAVPGIPLVDTLKIQSEGLSRGTRDRNQFTMTQTPQCFHREILEEAFRLADKDGFSGTDDASYVERLPGARIAIVDGDPDNYKITTEYDLNRARTMLANSISHGYRCGEGYDAHRLVPDRPLMLGGVNIPFDRGLEGHSDADVLCHAISDALLGAAALGDLGAHFPDSDPAYKNISSVLLLEKIHEMLKDSGFSISNVDATLILQKPKVAPYIKEMKVNLAKALQTSPENISVKATTTEGMGFEGRAEGVSCRVVVMVKGD